VSQPELRVIVNRAGAARRPVSHVWMLWVTAGAALASLVGYAIVKRFVMGGQ
jgi:hypothetical protein